MTQDKTPEQHVADITKIAEHLSESLNRNDRALVSVLHGAIGAWYQGKAEDLAMIVHPLIKIYLEELRSQRKK